METPYQRSLFFESLQYISYLYITTERESREQNTQSKTKRGRAVRGRGFTTHGPTHSIRRRSRFANPPPRRSLLRSSAHLPFLFRFSLPYTRQKAKQNESQWFTMVSTIQSLYCVHESRCAMEISAEYICE